MTVRVLNPTLEELSRSEMTVPRLPSLDGRRVGLLDNSKVNVRELLDEVEEILRSRYGVAEVVRLRKSDPSRPAPEPVLAQMAGLDAVISAVGD